MENKKISWYIEEFMIYCRSKDLRPKTMASYEQALRLFERWLREEQHIDDVSKISESIIRRYIISIKDRGKYTFYSDEKQMKTNKPDRRRDYRNKVSDGTINNYLRNIRVFLNWLDESYILSKNPMQNIKPLRTTRKSKDFINDEDFIKLVGLLDKSYFSEYRDFIMINLMLDTGMRLGECTTLLLDDLDVSHRVIHLREDETKGRKDRVVFFSEKTERMLRRWIQYKDRYVETAYLFPIKSNGGHVSVGTFETNFKHYLRRAGLSENISPHCLRNNFAKRCLMNGMDIYTLSRILGHSSVEVTENAYLDLTEEDIGRQFEKFSPLATIR